jgi:hypothetical protein
LLAHARDNFAHYANVDVCFKKSGANLAHYFIDISLGETAFAFKALDYPL